jgi:hypothetical protein
MRPESRRPAHDVLDALVSFVCFACVGIGAGGALAGAGYQLAHRGDLGEVFMLAGLAVCFGGASGAVVMAQRGDRG